MVFIEELKSHSKPLRASRWIQRATLYHSKCFRDVRSLCCDKLSCHGADTASAWETQTPGGSSLSEGGVPHTFVGFISRSPLHPRGDPGEESLGFGQGETESNHSEMCPEHSVSQWGLPSRQPDWNFIKDWSEAWGVCSSSPPGLSTREMDIQCPLALLSHLKGDRGQNQNKPNPRSTCGGGSRRLTRVYELKIVNNLFLSIADHWVHFKYSLPTRKTENLTLKFYLLERLSVEGGI